MQAYGYRQLQLNNIHNIPNYGNHFINYEGLNFLIKSSKENTNIVFIFHGALWGGSTLGTDIAQTGKNRIVFRGYDFDILNTDIVCICDFLLNKYDEYEVNWTLSTKKFDAESIYESIIRYLISKKQYKQILFTGSSAGGYPSIKFASKFNENCLVSNPQLYLEHYGHKHIPYSGFHKLKHMVAYYDDEILYSDKDIETHILKNHPKKIILYNNILDHTFKRDIVPFVDFIGKHELQKILDIHFFIYQEELPAKHSQHHILFPKNAKHLDILINYFKES